MYIINQHTNQFLKNEKSLKLWTQTQHFQMSDAIANSTCLKCSKVFERKKCFKNHQENLLDPCDHICGGCQFQGTSRKCFYRHKIKCKQYIVFKTNIVNNTDPKPNTPNDTDPKPNTPNDTDPKPNIVNSDHISTSSKKKRDDLSKNDRKKHFLHFYGGLTGVCIICKKNEVRLYNNGHHQCHIVRRDICPDNKDARYRVPACSGCNSSMGTVNLFDYVYNYYSSQLFDIATKLFLSQNSITLHFSECQNIFNFITNNYNIMNDIKHRAEIKIIMNSQQLESELDENQKMADLSEGCDNLCIMFLNLPTFQTKQMTTKLCSILTKIENVIEFTRNSKILN